VINEETKENQFDKRLMDLNIHSYFIFKIEVKAPEEPDFEEYNPNWGFLRILSWDKVIEHHRATQAASAQEGAQGGGPDGAQDDSEEGDDFVFDLRKVDQLPVDLVRVDMKLDKVEDLERKIAEKLQIPLEQVIILGRHEASWGGNVRVEYINMDWAKPKILADLRTKLDHAHLLFVEQNDPKSKFEEFNWHKCMQSAKEMRKLHITSKGFEGFFDAAPMEVTISKDKTLRQLKEKIGKRLQVAPGEFRIKR